MSQDETMHVSSTGGRKAGNDERYDLIPTEPLRLLARHYGVGAKKYDDDNWRKGYDWRSSYAALSRHLNQFWAGEDIDAETGTPHIIAVAWHAFTLAEFSETHPGFDTRLKTVDQRAKRESALERAEGWVASFNGMPYIYATGYAGGITHILGESVSGFGAGGGGANSSDYTVKTLDAADTRERYRDNVNDIWEYRHGVWGFRMQRPDSRWYTYEDTGTRDSDFGPYTRMPNEN